MERSAPGLVAIVREFLQVDLAMRRLFERHRSRAVTWEEVRALCSDDESSPLFRLKEGCHALFRSRRGEVQSPQTREMLFDLAVGSLFHEAMKLRENFYQQEIYGPRMRALQRAGGADAHALFVEFEKILSGVTASIEQGIRETEALLERTREQLAVLIRGVPDDGLIPRSLIALQGEVEQVFDLELDRLLERLYGSAARAYECAGRSYLSSGYYAEAEQRLDQALARGAQAGVLQPLIAYARGLRAYLAGRYSEAVDALQRWAQSPESPEPALLDLACNVLDGLDVLLAEEERAALLPRAAVLRARLRPA